jgi:hypothetical protein
MTSMGWSFRSLKTTTEFEPGADHGGASFERIAKRLSEKEVPECRRTNYLRPVSNRPITIRWISEVPS